MTMKKTKRALKQFKNVNKTNRKHREIIYG